MYIDPGQLQDGSKLTTNAENKLPIPRTVDEQADSAARKCIMYFGPGNNPRLSIGPRNQVAVDAGGKIHLIDDLDEYRKSVYKGTWNAVIKLADELREKKIKIGFFSSTPQGGERLSCASVGYCSGTPHPHDLLCARKLTTPFCLYSCSVIGARFVLHERLNGQSRVAVLTIHSDVLRRCRSREYSIFSLTTFVGRVYTETRLLHIDASRAHPVLQCARRRRCLVSPVREFVRNCLS